MFSAPGLPDLDALDPAALKAIIFTQHDRFKAQDERYAATLTSRAGEIERLKLLVEKLQRMLFGACHRQLKNPHFASLEKSPA